MEENRFWFLEIFLGLGILIVGVLFFQEKPSAETFANFFTSDFFGFDGSILFFVIFGGIILTSVLMNHPNVENRAEVTKGLWTWLMGFASNIHLSMFAGFTALFTGTILGILLQISTTFTVLGSFFVLRPIISRFFYRPKLAKTSLPSMKVHEEKLATGDLGETVLEGEPIPKNKTLLNMRIMLLVFGLPFFGFGIFVILTSPSMWTFGSVFLFLGGLVLLSFAFSFTQKTLHSITVTSNGIELREISGKQENTEFSEISALQLSDTLGHLPAKTAVAFYRKNSFLPKSYLLNVETMDAVEMLSKCRWLEGTKRRSRYSDLFEFRPKVL